MSKNVYMIHGGGVREVYGSAGRAADRFAAMVEDKGDGDDQRLRFRTYTESYWIERPVGLGFHVRRMARLEFFQSVTGYASGGAVTFTRELLR